MSVLSNQPLYGGIKIEAPIEDADYETRGRDDAAGKEMYKVVVENEGKGLSIYVPDHGTDAMVPGAGPVVLLEYLNGVPRLVVWADITSEEPTHVIPLDGAHESKRLPDDPEPSSVIPMLPRILKDPE